MVYFFIKISKLFCKKPKFKMFFILTLSSAVCYFKIVKNGVGYMDSQELIRKFQIIIDNKNYALIKTTFSLDETITLIKLMAEGYFDDSLLNFNYDDAIIFYTNFVLLTM